MAATFCALQTTGGQTVDSGAILPDKPTDFDGRPGILAQSSTISPKTGPKIVPGDRNVAIGRGQRGARLYRRRPP